jgi:hypothetical protein
MAAPTARFSLGRRHIAYLVIAYWLFVSGFAESPWVLPLEGEEPPTLEGVPSTESPTQSPSEGGVSTTVLPSPSQTIWSAHPHTPPEDRVVSSPPPPSTIPIITYPLPVFFPNAAHYANPFSVYPATEPIYPNQMVSDSHPRLRHLLSIWTYLAAALDLRYVALFGTLLGCLRNGKIIPWDTDMDIAVDRDTAVLLSYLALNSPPRFTLNGITIELNSAVADHQPWQSGETRLIVNRQRALNLPGYGPRYNRKGEVVDSQEDSVSFAGPFARLVSYVEGDGTSHMDLFCVEEFAGHYGEEATEVGPERASFPKKVEACELEGYAVWCPSKEDYEPVLVYNYGEQYLSPPRHRDLQENSP